jgi:hypothetical protein
MDRRNTMKLKRLGHPLASLAGKRLFHKRLALSAKWLEKSGARILTIVEWAETPKGERKTP